MTREYDRLVRDRIPAIIRADGDEPVVHAADEAEYGRRVVDKLEEEVAEFRESGRTEELADVLEVVHAIREQREVTAKELREKGAAKRAERGGFDGGIVLERVE